MAFDLRADFPRVSQRSPLYIHTDLRRNQKIGSIKRSAALKSKALLCHNCNTALTAPYDRAWQGLSTYLRRTDGLKAGRQIKLSRVFPGDTKRGMLFVHLYFVKIFGCAIKEYDIPIKIEPFRNALMDAVSHPKVWIAIGVNNSMHTGRSDLEIESLHGKPVFATWFYIVGNVAVNIMYAERGQKRQGLIGAWHPTTVSKRLAIVGF